MQEQQPPARLNAGHPIVLGNAVRSMATQPVGGLWNLTTANKPLLVRLVKLCQKRNLTSTAGTWADFVKDSAAGLKDPNLVPEGSLAEFIGKVQGEAEKALLSCVVEWDKEVQKDSGAFDELDRAVALSGAWAAVKQTRRHSQFQRQFDFPSWDEGWRRVPRKAPSLEGEAPVLVGVDCEMCETATNKKELLKVCCVSQEGKVLLEELVKPSSEVTDYRSHITGIKEQDMQGVTFTLEKAQKVLLKLVQDEGVILVGHSISHDLQALRFDYQPVIDTALIFKFKELGLKIPSLQQLAQAVLGRSVRQEGEPHNCRVDAQAAMELVQHIARNGLPRPLPQPEARVSREQLKQLFVHRIPKGTSHDDLKAVFPHSLPQVQEVHSIPGSDKKVLLEFKDPQHANMAFKGLPVEAHRDSSGLFQKLVSLTRGAARGKLVCVRKMAGHNGRSLGQDEGSSERRSKRRREQAKASRSEDEPEL